MPAIPYLHFNGQCAEAFTFYEKCLGGKIVALFTYASMPGEGHVPEEWRDKMMHARLAFDEGELMGCDPPPGRYEKPQGFSVTLNLKDPAHGERVFRALADNGTIEMPFGETFWSAGFGMLVDRFGIPWMINCEKAG